MDTLLVLLVKVFFLLLKPIYQNQIRNPSENQVLMNEAMTNAISVYITNRYFQQVIAIGDDGIQTRERIGTQDNN